MPSQHVLPENLLSCLCRLALAGGRESLRHYKRSIDVNLKSDNSPVTQADLAVDQILVAGLEREFPDIKIVTEERAASHTLGEDCVRYFLVDPIDGTKEFINETDEFTINIGLIDAGVPVAGVVFAPAKGRMFSGSIVDGCVEEHTDLQCARIGSSKKLQVNESDNSALIGVASRSHLTKEISKFLAHNKIRSCKNAGSSLKFCLLATGEADIYPRFGPTMEWDTAAGHAVLAAAGGVVTDLSGETLKYGKPQFRNPHFIAASRFARFSVQDLGK